MTELEKYIQLHFGVNNEDLSLISSFFKPAVLKKGEFFLKTGKQSDRLGFVQTGIIREFVSINDKEITKWISTKGYFVVDLSSFIFHQPARWNIQALTDCELHIIDTKEYQKIGEIIPRWAELEKLFIAKCFLTLEDRVFSLLSLSAEERYDTFFEFKEEFLEETKEALWYLGAFLGYKYLYDDYYKQLDLNIFKENSFSENNVNVLKETNPLELELEKVRNENKELMGKVKELENANAEVCIHKETEQNLPNNASDVDNEQTKDYIPQVVELKKQEKETELNNEISELEKKIESTEIYNLENKTIHNNNQTIDLNYLSIEVLCQILYGRDKKNNKLGELKQKYNENNKQEIIKKILETILIS